MPAADLLLALHRSPFVPFRVVTSDGTTCEVRHPDLVMVGTGSAIIGYPDPSNPSLYGSYDVVALRHVIRLEPREEAAASA